MRAYVDKAHTCSLFSQDDANEEVVQKATEYLELRPVVAFEEYPNTDDLLIQDDAHKFHLSKDNIERSPQHFCEDIEQVCSFNNNVILPVVAKPSISNNHDQPLDYPSDDSLKDPNFTINERDMLDSSDIPLAMVRKNIPKNQNKS
ncbi:hypothetical protein JTB14_012401 [Gonioctena quinquepunctata]|nr:hypothetical protein JTB14_012401 [Gonioctena quinquepunctata]